MSLRTMLVLALGLIAAPPLAAQQTPPQEDRVIANPHPASFQVHGLTPAPKPVKDATLEDGGKALRLSLPGGGTPYSVVVNIPIVEDVKAGDKLIFAVWLKLEKGENDAPATTVNAQVQLSAAPYTAIFGKPLTVTGEWQFLQVSGKADRDYAKGAINATLHVNTGKQVLRIGPAAVVNRGQ